MFKIQQQPIRWLEELSKRDIRLVKLLDNDLTLKEAAKELNISYSVASKKRKKLFTKTNTSSVVGLINFFKKIGRI
jgi:FixJ family two-component response regulator